MFQMNVIAQLSKTWIYCDSDLKTKIDENNADRQGDEIKVAQNNIHKMKIAHEVLA